MKDSQKLQKPTTITHSSTSKSWGTSTSSSWNSSGSFNQTTGPYVVNGQSYDTLEDMPSDIRNIYQKGVNMLKDSDGNGIPDFAENFGNSLLNTKPDQSGTTSETKTGIPVSETQQVQTEADWQHTAVKADNKSLKALLVIVMIAIIVGVYYLL